MEIKDGFYIKKLFSDYEQSIVKFRADYLGNKNM